MRYNLDLWAAAALGAVLGWVLGVAQGVQFGRTHPPVSFPPPTFQDTEPLFRAPNTPYQVFPHPDGNPWGHCDGAPYRGWCENMRAL